VPFDRDLIAHWNLDRAEAQAYYGSREGPPDWLRSAGTLFDL